MCSALCFLRPAAPADSRGRQEGQQPERQHQQTSRERALPNRISPFSGGGIISIINITDITVAAITIIIVVIVFICYLTASLIPAPRGCTAAFGLPWKKPPNLPCTSPGRAKHRSKSGNSPLLSWQGDVLSSLT